MATSHIDTIREALNRWRAEMVPHGELLAGQVAEVDAALASLSVPVASLDAPDGPGDWWFDGVSNDTGRVLREHYVLEGMEDGLGMPFFGGHMHITHLKGKWYRAVTPWNRDTPQPAQSSDVVADTRLICDKCNDYLEAPSYCEICYDTMVSAQQETQAALDAKSAVVAPDWASADNGAVRFQWAFLGVSDDREGYYFVWYLCVNKPMRVQSSGSWAYVNSDDLYMPTRKKVDVPAGVDFRQVLAQRPSAGEA